MRNLLAITSISTPATWYGAKIVSEYRGGHLVTITSSAENAHVKSMIGDLDCWIGATDKDSEGTWKWVNGETFSYSNWNSAEPNNDNAAANEEGVENFAHIRAGSDTWNDKYGYATYPFVCEIDRAYTITYNANGGSGAPSSQAKAVGQNIKTFTVSFDSVGGGTFDSVTVEYGKTIPSLPVPEKRGLFFKGWYTNSGNRVTESTVIKSNLALTAKWSEPTCLNLPAAMKTIEEEAFMWTAPNVVVVPDKVTSIGARAFANNADLYTVVVYAGSVSVASDAFANCPNLTVYGYADTMIDYYCSAKKIPFAPLGQTEYIVDDNLPIGATVTAEKWTYSQDRTETTTSTATSLSGWTQTGDYSWQQTGTGTYKYASFPGGFDTGNSLYQKYTNGSALPSSEVTSDTTKRDAGSSSFLTYIYWHWTFVDSLNSASDNSNVIISDVKEYNVQVGNVRRDFIYFDAFESTTNYGTVGPGTNGDVDAAPARYAWRGIAGDVSHWWHRFEVYQQPYTDYQKVFTYTRTVTEEKESSTAVTEGSGISNVKHLVKYTF